MSWDCRSPSADGVTVRLAAREEVRPAGSEAGDLHIHSLFILQISHDLRGRATVDLPLTIPPAWHGERHQVSWAIEVETHASGIARLSRFPIAVASPPRLHVTSTSCPADSNLAAATSLALAIPIADVAPGEAIAGVITWKLTRVPRYLELRLICRCTGVAGTEERVAASCRLEQPAAQGRSGFQLQHPGAPVSWEGALMTCSWHIEAVADEKVFAVMGLTVVAAK